MQHNKKIEEKVSDASMEITKAKLIEAFDSLQATSHMEIQNTLVNQDALLDRYAYRLTLFQESLKNKTSNKQSAMQKKVNYQTPLLRQPLPTQVLPLPIVPPKSIPISNEPIPNIPIVPIIPSIQTSTISTSTMQTRSRTKNEGETKLSEKSSLFPQQSTQPSNEPPVSSTNKNLRIQS